jgi:hypothetical protein
MNKFNKFYKPTNEFDELLVSDVYVGERESSIRADFEAADAALDNAIKAEADIRKSEDDIIKADISSLDNKFTNRKTINVKTISGDINRYFERLIRIENVDINELKVQLGQTIYLVEGHDDALTGYHTYEEYICQNPESVTVDTLPIMVRFGAVDSILARGEDVEGEERQNRFGSVELCHNLYTNDANVWKKYFEKDLDGNLIHDNPKAGKAVAPCALRDFVINDADIRTKFAEADRAIRAEFADADSKIREDFASADLNINNRIDSIDVRTSNLETDVEYLMVEVGGNEIEGEVEESKSRIDKIEQIIGMGERCDICHENGHCTVDGKCNEEHPLTNACSILCKLERIDERIEENFKTIYEFQETNSNEHLQINERIDGSETRIDAVEKRTGIIEGQIGDVNTRDTIKWTLFDINNNVIPTLRTELRTELQNYSDKSEEDANKYTDSKIDYALLAAADKAEELDDVALSKALEAAVSADNTLENKIHNWVNENFTNTHDTTVEIGLAVTDSKSYTNEVKDDLEKLVSETATTIANNIETNYVLKETCNTKLENLKETCNTKLENLKETLESKIEDARLDAIQEAKQGAEAEREAAKLYAKTYVDELKASIDSDIDRLGDEINDTLADIEQAKEDVENTARDYVDSKVNDIIIPKISAAEESAKTHADTRIAEEITNHVAEHHKFNSAIISAVLPADDLSTADIDERHIILKYSDLQYKLPGNIPASALTIVVNSIRYTGYKDGETEIVQVVPDVFYRGTITNDNVDSREIEIRFTGETDEKNVLISITYYNNSGDNNPIIYI